MRRSKRYKENTDRVDAEQRYSPEDAVKLLKGTNLAKFDETVEVHFNLGIDPRHADQQLRGTLNLPHGTGKQVKIAVLAPADQVEVVKAVGVEMVGAEDLIEKIQEGWLGFDILIAHPSMMPKLGKLGRVLGSKGLMPNLKSGTVSNDLEKTAKEFMGGKLEYRNDKNGNLHVGIGKVSFDEKQLVENFEMVYDTVQKIKPTKAKGVYMKSVTLTSTMGVSITIEALKVKWKKVS